MSQFSGIGGAGGPRHLPVQLADLLLIVILALGGARLGFPLLADALDLGSPSASNPIHGVLVLLSAQSVLLFLVVYVVAVRWRGVSFRELGFAPLPDGWALKAVGVALLSFPVVSLVNLVQQQLTGQELQNPQIQVLLPQQFSWATYIGTVLVAGVLAPVTEELAFRGLLYRWLKERLGLPVAMPLSAFAFALLHGIVGLVLAITVLGVILAWIYERSGSIWAPIIVHGFYNAFVTTALYFALAQGLPIP